MQFSFKLAIIAVTAGAPPHGIGKSALSLSARLNAPDNDKGIIGAEGAGVV
jgi:hypothetical protein